MRLTRYGIPRFTVVIASLAVLIIVAGRASASRGQPGSGLLVGLTQISYGCPGPVRNGQPPCEHWNPFPHAKFAIRQIGENGQPLRQIIRVAVSDRLGRFSVRLSSGDYQLTPLAQAHTSGGRKLTVRIRFGHATRILVRFLGVPRML